MNVTTVKNAKVGDLVSIELSTDVYKVVRVGEDGVIMENIEDPTKTTKVSNNTVVFIYDAPVGALISALSDFRNEVEKELKKSEKGADKLEGKIQVNHEPEVCGCDCYGDCECDEEDCECDCECDCEEDCLDEDDDEYEGDYEDSEELDNETGVSVYELIDQLDELEERGWNTRDFRRDLSFVLSAMALDYQGDGDQDSKRPMDALSYLHTR